jgi:hypothetical protein
MLWLILVLLAVAATVPIAAAKGMPRWGWLAITVIAAGAECMLLGKPSPSWETRHVVASWVLTIILPWAAVAMFLWFSRYPSRPIFTMLGLLIVYALVTVIGLVAGDISGLVPQ